MVSNHDRKTQIIFLLVTLSWSTSWYFAKIQIKYLPEELLVCYRFFFAGLLILLYSIWNKKNFKFSKKDYQLILVQAICVFSVNHLLFYHAMNYISSGVVAALFSLSILLSAIFNFLFYKVKTPKTIISSGIVGIIGLTMIFANEIKGSGLNLETLEGALFCIIGVALFSIASAFTQHQGSKDLVSKTALAMILGSAISLLTALGKGENLAFSTDLGYLLSLTYLVLIPGIIGFLGILYLIAHIGGAKAAYTSLIYPVLALIISSFFENYHFGYLSILGLILIIYGNYSALKK